MQIVLGNLGHVVGGARNVRITKRNNNRIQVLVICIVIALHFTIGIFYLYDSFIASSGGWILIKS